MSFRGIVRLTILLGLVCWVDFSSASTFRAIPLSRLVKQSDLVVVATPVSFECRWATVGASQRLVTDFTLEVHWTLRGADIAGEDIVVRTLGGSWGNLGQVVHGEALLIIGQTSLLFLKQSRDSSLHVFGWGQGHYPLSVDANGEWRLGASAGLEGVLELPPSTAWNDDHCSASKTLANQRLVEVQSLMESSEAEP